MIRVAALLLLAGCAPVLTKLTGSFVNTMVVPEPDGQFSFRVGGKEWLRYHTGPQTPKPYFYPVMGPSGWPVSRLTHPQDPTTHDHHLSLWIGHASVNGLSFWEARQSPARIVHDRVAKIVDGDDASLSIRARWLDGEKKTLLFDDRVWTLRPRFETIGPNGFGEYALDLQLTLSTPAAPVTLGKSSFGLLSFRVAKFMGTLDGGGTIRNSEGLVNEAQLMNPHKRARWCDYSGPAAPGEVNGVGFLDHPSNPNHPTHFHVRGDGWMGASLTQETAIEITKERPLVLRYRFRIHRGPADPAAIDADWAAWGKP
jgi:hypothetical protein